MNLHLLIVIVSVLGFLSNPTQSLRFDLPSGHTKCIAEEIYVNSMTLGKYSVVNSNEGHPLPDSHKITVKVTSAHGSNYHSADNVAAGQFAFTAAETGDYMCCFWTPVHKPEVTVTIDFEWKTGVSAKDWPSVAKKGKVDVMEMELQQLQDTISAIHQEMLHLREREEEMQELNKATNTKMAWLSLLSLGVCLSVAGLQVWHLKSFFEKKKLI